MKKILFISNISNRITNFSIPSIDAAKSLGYEFHMAANYINFKDDADQYGVKIHHIDIDRNPFSLKNITAYKQILELIETEEIDAIHCNTPIGGVLGRLSGYRAGINKVIYTAHGFHFYEGSSFVSRVFLKFAEKIMARYTDAIITMNSEDYKAAQKFKLRNKGKIYYIPGVGVDTKDYQIEEFNHEKVRNSLGLTEKEIVLIAMGDLIERKNYETSIKAIAKTGKKNIHFLICGEGPKLESLKMLAKKLEIEKQIHFLGFRSDIKILLSVADIFLFTTYQEGLPRSMMEAMSAGLPCIASEVRGNIDLIEDGKGGFLRHPDDVKGFAKAINTLVTDKKLKKTMGSNNLSKIKKYDVNNVKEIMKGIYEKEL